MRTEAIKLGAVLGAALSLTLAGQAQAAVTIGSGHVDVLAFSYDDTANALDIDVRDEGTATVHDPADVVFDVHSGHLVDRPGAVACKLDAGDNWVLPRTQATGLIWAGWSTEDLDLADFGGALQAELVDAVTPAGGNVSVYDATTGDVRFHTDPACDASGTAITESHHHPTWVFTEPGTYELTFQVGGTHAVDGPVTSPQITYTFDVG
ncbi:choice-of-anchor M domain-containing protein [Glycomyces sp. A-F 0318]|uniref:choice-of-anchor M domain-containing protein n=1 Tax=Glycomyces amatae TaxID=2881355 RepID=UPI001E395262|nr:choice-of-anchor M domain-containing protein [Glycomyces amatae]MCD0447249.1 choice-of-anchor M domain-containing protein [Glycomyces amatae]